MEIRFVESNRLLTQCKDSFFISNAECSRLGRSVKYHQEPVLPRWQQGLEQPEIGPESPERNSTCGVRTIVNSMYRFCFAALKYAKVSESSLEKGRVENESRSESIVKRFKMLISLRLP